MAACTNTFCDHYMISTVIKDLFQNCWLFVNFIPSPHLEYLYIKFIWSKMVDCDPKYLMLSKRILVNLYNITFDQNVFIMKVEFCV